MPRKHLSLLLLVLSLSTATVAVAGSETPFPSDWQSWTAATTTLTKIGALPGCDADVSALPPIYQETVETYCAVRPEGPGAVAVLVRPEAMDRYRARDGKMPDGTNMILHLKELQLLFVSGHKGGNAMYGVFKEDGTDVTDASGGSALAAKVCRECHTGYSAFCVNGQCGATQ